jgi:O-antigen/teichoic acid export membrane protein
MLASHVWYSEQLSTAIALMVGATPPILFYLHRHRWKLSIKALLTLVALLAIGLLWVQNDLVKLLSGRDIQIWIAWELCIFLFVVSSLVTYAITLLESSGLHSTEDQERPPD